MYTIALIGAGQLGSRHLQALAKINMPVNLQVIDPNKASLRIAQQRFLEIPLNDAIKSLLFSTSIDDLNSQIDVCIIATNSNVRFNVLQEVLKYKKVKNIIFEKVLFQKIKDFKNAMQLISQDEISAWVNCPRRLVPFYEEISDYFNGESISLKASGGDWRLGCNAIHFIDFIAFLTKGNTNYEIDLSSLDKVCRDSVRDGFKEFTGICKGKFENGSTFILKSIHGATDPFKIEIESENIKIMIDQTQGKSILSKKENGWQEELLEFKIPMQSELTHLVVQDILEKGNCGLTSFEDSCALHLPMIEAFNNFVAKIEGKPCTVCPIT